MGVEDAARYIRTIKVLAKLKFAQTNRRFDVNRPFLYSSFQFHISVRDVFLEEFLAERFKAAFFVEADGV